MSGKTIHGCICCMLLLLLVCCIIAVPAVALTGVERRITTSTYYTESTDPAISGNYIVWRSSDDLYFYDIASHTMTDLTPGTNTLQYLADIDGPRVVYTNLPPTSMDVILYDVTTSLTTPLASGKSDFSPAIQGNHVVWVHGMDAGLRSILLADIDSWTLTTVFPGATDEFVENPRIDGDYIVWPHKVGSGSYCQIRLYRISTDETWIIVADAATNSNPDISGDNVVWQSNFNGNWDIYRYSISSGETTRLTTDPKNQQHPRISGNRVVWDDDRNGKLQIWTLDLTTLTEEPVSPTPFNYDQKEPDIDGDRIVWSDYRNWYWDIYVFTVGAVNHPPVADAGNDQTRHLIGGPFGNLVVLDGSGSSDPDGDILTCTWSITSRPEGSLATLSDATTQKPVFTVDKIGGYIIQLIVNDGSTDSAPDTVTVTAIISQPPVAEAGDDQSVSVGDVVTLDGSGSSDPDDDTITYAWTITTEPAGSSAALSGATAEKPTFTADKAGEYVIQLIVNDGTAGSDPDSVTVTASVVNQPPVADAGDDQSVSVGAVVTLDGSGSSDPDDDTITCVWTFTTKPAGSSAVLSDATVKKPTFTADKAGAYVVQLIVNDGSADSDPDTVTVTATQATITVPVDVEPGFCPNLIGVNMKGPILVIAIAGTADLDAKKIDPATIRLSREGIATTVKPRLSKVLDIATAYTPATACGCQKKLWDGKKDLVLVFDIGEVVTKLQLKDAVGTSVPLTISGNLKAVYGGTLMTGSDCAKILSICTEKIGQTI